MNSSLPSCTIACYVNELEETWIERLLAALWGGIGCHDIALVTAHVVRAMALYSASIEDLATTTCFLLFQEMGDVSKRIQYPVVDLLE